MTRLKLKSLIRTLMVFFTLHAVTSFVPDTDALARAGRGRSIGRPSGGGMGFRRSTPPPSYGGSPYYSRPTNPPPSGPSVPPPPASAPTPSRGGFWRGLAGGLAGGFLGSMLFGSLGQAGGMGGGYGGGGMGLIHIILVGLIGYFGYRWWKGRQTAAASSGILGKTSQSDGPGYNPSQHEGQWDQPPTYDAGVRFPAFAPTVAEGIDKDLASDLFFRIQGAWTRRDLKPVMEILGRELSEALSQDVQGLTSRREINRLENISVRSVEIVHSWTEQGTTYSTARFLANLLDYTVDEATGRVIEGSDTVPIKFQEDWTFAKEQGSDAWRVVGIEQVN